MKTKAELKNYFVNRIRIIDGLLEKQGHAYSPGYFHLLRVEIKKINSLFELLDFCTGKFKRKTFFKSYKIIFMQAGIIREYQLEEATLKKYVSVATLKIFQEGIKKKLRAELDGFDTIKSRFDFHKTEKMYKKILPFIKKAGDKKIINYLKSKQERIGKLLSEKELQTEEVHELRKHLKKYYYNLKSLKLPGRQGQINKIAALQDLLGKWHDCIIIKGHIEKSMKSAGMPFNEKRQLKRVIQKISDDCNIYFEKINAERKLISVDFPFID